MRDVAALVGVSQQAVSLVFRNAPGVSDKTRERVFTAAAELGYRPDAAAQVLRSTRNYRLGVLFSLQQPYEVDLVEALYPAAARHGYQLVLGAQAAGRDQRTAVDELLGARTEALILIAPADDRDQLTELAGQLPVVDIGRRLPGTGTGADVVRCADARGARLAVEHLVRLGHREIVHVDGGTLPGAADRRTAYRTTMRRHGLADAVRVLPGDRTEDSGERAARTLLGGDRLPTAVFAANDRCAHGLLQSLTRAGVDVPTDVSLVGYDDSRVARLPFVDLTSIRQDATVMADLAIQAAVERLDAGRTKPREFVVEPTLTARGSTAPPRPRASLR
jgi:DNA-binding LacI/PurR family transcriptional regulator